MLGGSCMHISRVASTPYQVLAGLGRFIASHEPQKPKVRVAV